MALGTSRTRLAVVRLAAFAVLLVLLASSVPPAWDSATLRTIFRGPAGDYPLPPSPIEDGPPAAPEPDDDLPYATCDVPLAEVEYLDEIGSFVPLDGGPSEHLRVHCLVALRRPGWSHDVGEAYGVLREGRLPIFVTSDSVLHGYHVLFDSVLQETETEFFVPDLKAMMSGMMEASAGEEGAIALELQPIARKNTAFFAVALRLLDPGAPVPASVEDLVGSELALIAAHSGFTASPIFNAEPMPEAEYSEDYSQYVPRGHYDVSEAMRGYFRSMLWLGRIGLRLSEVAETQGAILMADLWDRVDMSVRDRWWRMYDITSFFVGEADDLLPPDYLWAVRQVYGPLSGEASEVLDPARLADFRALVAAMRNPRIVSGLVLDTEDPVDATKGLRFMGQRYVMDSHVLQLMVYDDVVEYTGSGFPFTRVESERGPIRGFPRGLDVIAAMGSRLAAAIVAEEGDADYVGYANRALESRSLFENLTDAGWNDTLYLRWLRVLRAGLGSYRNETFPLFMRTEAYAAEKVHTGLASWAQLRRDTILYAKQSYTGLVSSVPPTPPIVYVEPVVRMYERLEDLVHATRDGLSAYGILNESAAKSLGGMEELLATLLSVSEKELEGADITDRERAYLAFIDLAFGDILSVPVEKRDTRVVADVHTDPNSRKVLEEATGDLALIVVAVQHPDGTWFAAIGPILTHYEFKHPMDDRLTDGAWRELLAASPPASAPWLSRFFA